VARARPNYSGVTGCVGARPVQTTRQAIRGEEWRRGHFGWDHVPTPWAARRGRRREYQARQASGYNARACLFRPFPLPIWQQRGTGGFSVKQYREQSLRAACVRGREGVREEGSRYARGARQEPASARLPYVKAAQRRQQLLQPQPLPVFSGSPMSIPVAGASGHC